MKTQEELGRKEWVMNQIIADAKMSLEEELIELQEMPENFINSIYDISYDEMSSSEKKESISWIESELRKNM